jgi:hypothetical protein
MRLRWYAESPTRRTVQIATDVLAVLGLLLCLWIGLFVHGVTEKLAGPGREIEAAGSSLAGRMEDAASAAGDIPLAGDQLASPFEGAGQAGRSIEAAGVHQQQAVASLASALGWTAGGVPALLLLALWVPRRVLHARQDAHAARIRDADVGLDVLALRALARQPLGNLARLGPEVLDGWRAGDVWATEAIAVLELRRLGLRSRTTGGD